MRGLIHGRFPKLTAQAMMSLLDRGELIREVEGLGKRQAIWRKAALNASGVRA